VTVILTIVIGRLVYEWGKLVSFLSCLFLGTWCSDN